MNFLAHLYLADDTPASMIGNLLPDLVRGRPDPALPAEVLRGVRRHRRVDAFTDTHPVFARSRARLRDRHGLFSGILVDVFYDHFLAVNWSRWHEQPLVDFIERAHGALTGHPHLMPPSMRPITRRMAEQDWLGSYASFEGLARTLGQMSRRFEARLERPVRLAPAVDDLRRHYEGLTNDFDEFFPQLIGHVSCQPTRS